MITARATLDTYQAGLEPLVSYGDCRSGFPF